MKTKTCFKCGAVKQRSEFYKHSEMADGLLGKCKECAKRDVHERYVLIGGRPEYERKRYQDPNRRRAAARYLRQMRKKHPQRNIARQRVAYALRTGKITKQPCEVCGDGKSQAHHDDYRKPLEVRWLCFMHHQQRHGKTVRM